MQPRNDAFYTADTTSQVEGGASSSRNGATLLVQGMGGSGKTVIACGLAHDAEVGTRFALICFAGIGQDGNLRDLQRSLHLQIAGAPLDSSLQDDAEIFAALQAAAVDKNLLLLIDDAWSLDHWARWLTSNRRFWNSGLRRLDFPQYQP